MKFDLSEYIAADSVDLDPVGTARKEIKELIMVGDENAMITVHDKAFSKYPDYNESLDIGTVGELLVDIESDAEKLIAFECVLAFLRGDADAKSRAERLVDSVVNRAISCAQKAGGLNE